MVALDVNRAPKKPCSFTDYATCPVTPAENKLVIAVGPRPNQIRERVEAVVTVRGYPPEVPRWMAWRSMMPDQIATMFIHDAEISAKCSRMHRSSSISRSTRPMPS
jgi:hypothetical protein